MKADPSTENEALRARLNIRDFFLNHTVREVYENIGQVLSLVRMELSVAAPNDKMKGHMESAGRLVGQSIRDLRLMTRSFHPDADLLQEGGFSESLEKVLAILYPVNAPILICQEKQNDIQSVLKLIVFDVLLKLLISLEHKKQACTHLAVIFTKTSLKINLDFTGDGGNPKQDHIKASVTPICRNIRLLQGEFNVLKTRSGLYNLKLMIPIK